MYISRVRIKNWRNFTSADVKLLETVYMVGPNASGKSNFLDIFRFMRDIANPKGGGLQQALTTRGGLSKVRSLAARANPKVELEFEFRESLATLQAEPDWKYFLSIKNEGGGKRRPLVAREIITREGEEIVSRPDAEDEKDPERLTETYLEQINTNKDFRDIVAFFEQVLYMHLVPQLLKFSDQLSLRHSEDDPFGQGFLEEISKTPTKSRNFRLNQIEQIMKKVIPNLKELKFLQDEITGRPHLEMLYSHWRPNAGWQREDQFSDGTLRLIATIWTLLASSSLILLEEPELSLHEAIVGQIPDMIYRARQSRKKSGGQIIISTHSYSMLSSKSISGNFLILKPGVAGEATIIEPPTESDFGAMKAGLSPADVLLPKTAVTIGAI